MYAVNDSDQVMRMSISDSEPTVNRDADGFGIIIPQAAISLNMAGNRDEVVSSFVRMRIREWKASGRELQELARLAGIAKSSPSQVLLGTGVARKTRPGYAKAFGYPSEDALLSAAWEWWKAEGQAGEDAVFVPQSDAQREAIDLVIGLQQGTAAQIATILAAYSHPRFRDRDKDWWLQALLAELRRDRETLADDQRAREATGAAQKKVREAQAAKRTPSQAPPKRSRRAG